MAMELAFSARQKLDLVVPGSLESLTAYLQQEGRVVRVLLGSDALQVLGPARYRYTLPRFKVFQLQVQPVVDLVAAPLPRRLVIRSCRCRLDGPTLAVNNFQLQLESWLEARGEQLEGEAALAVGVNRPELLRLIPKTVLEGTGGRVLAGVLGRIKAGISRKLSQDFQDWCHEQVSPAGSPPSPGSSPES